MPNTILTPKIIAQEALMVLESQLTMAGLVHRDYSKEFVRVGDTITIRKPAKFVAKNFVGETHWKQRIQEHQEGYTDRNYRTEQKTGSDPDHRKGIFLPVQSPPEEHRLV